MTDPTYTVLVPRYLERFRCIAGECEDTCCANWKVEIEPDAVELYRKVEHPGLRVLLDSAVEETPPGRRTFRLKPDGTCHLLGEDRLCELHRKLGEGALSRCCSQFPRVENRIGERRERSLSLSCPEAARLALLDPAPMEFVTINEAPHRFSATADTNPASAHALLLSNHDGAFDDVRNAAVRILQERTLPLADRMVLLGMFLQLVDRVLRSSDPSVLRREIEAFLAPMRQGGYNEALARVPSNAALRAQLLLQLTQLRTAAGYLSPRYDKCREETLLGLNYRPGISPEELGATAELARKRHLEPFLRVHGHMLEHHVVNYVFRTLLPAGRGGSAFEDFIPLAVLYALVMMHLCGIAAHRGGMTPEAAIELIQSMSRSFEHNAAYMRTLLALLRNSGLNSLAHMAILVKG